MSLREFRIRDIDLGVIDINGVVKNMGLSEVTQQEYIERKEDMSQEKKTAFKKLVEKGKQTKESSSWTVSVTGLEDNEHTVLLRN